MSGPRILLVVVFVIFLASASMAQFEIAPDHFPDPGQESVGAGAARPEQLKRQITEQEILLSDYRTRIRAKSKELGEAWQSWVLTGNDAGQDLAFAMQQRQFEFFKKSLAPLIDDAEKKLSSLKAELRQVAQRQTRHVQAGKAARVTGTQSGETRTNRDECGPSSAFASQAKNPMLRKGFPSESLDATASEVVFQTAHYRHFIEIATTRRIP